MLNYAISHVLFLILQGSKSFLNDIGIPAVLLACTVILEPMYDVHESQFAQFGTFTRLDCPPSIAAVARSQWEIRWWARTIFQSTRRDRPLELRR